MKYFPGQLLKLRSVCEVPVSEYSEIRPPAEGHSDSERLSFLKLLRLGNKTQKSQERKVSQRKSLKFSFNAAAWLSFDGSPTSPISLWLVFRDANGEQSVLIDEQKVCSSESLMLSGTETVKCQGQVEYMRACIGGLNDAQRFSVDELYVRRAEDVVRHRVAV